MDSALAAVLAFVLLGAMLVCVVIPRASGGARGVEGFVVRVTRPPQPPPHKDPAPPKPITMPNPTGPITIPVEPKPPITGGPITIPVEPKPKPIPMPVPKPMPMPKPKPIPATQMVSDCKKGDIGACAEYNARRYPPYSYAKSKTKMLACIKRDPKDKKTCYAAAINGRL
jgi:outer membrane biosynthesis protein TonB